ncbi:hypothetical protein ACXXDK_04900 [Deinococcus sp. PESE-38]
MHLAGRDVAALELGLERPERPLQFGEPASFQLAQGVGGASAVQGHALPIL